MISYSVNDQLLPLKAQVLPTIITSPSTITFILWNLRMMSTRAFLHNFDLYHWQLQETVVVGWVGVDSEQILDACAGSSMSVNIIGIDARHTH